MGYDMHVECPDDEVLIQELRAELDTSIPARDDEVGRKRYLDLLDRYEEARGYFRLNIWGMRIARTAMAERGMLHNEGCPSDEAWAALPPYDEDDLKVDGGPAYRAAVDAIVGSCVEMPGIPVWKLCSNDGWLIRPIEILSALKLHADWVNEHPDAGVPVDAEEGLPVEWWDEWIGYLMLGAAMGGIRVY